MQAVNKIYVVGIGYKPLDKRAKDIICNSKFILASGRLFEVFKGYEEFEMVKDKVKLINTVDETINFIKSQISILKSQNITLLASGDPMFFGIGRRVVKEFGKDIVEILPDLSSIQMAFSKIKEPWDDAFLMSLHGGPEPEKRRRLPYGISDIPMLLQRHKKIAILTDRENNSAAIAKEILKLSAVSHQPSAVKIYVCERLGYGDEKITEGTPAEVGAMSFSEPNVVIIQNTEYRSVPSKVEGTQNKEIKFGLTENEVIHSKGLITKDEVRAVAIHKLRLPQRGVFWDIGAGSGSISIEVARLHPELKVYAIEKDEDQINHVKENRIKFNTTSIEIIEGEAPDALVNLPSSDRVFIGGSGSRLTEIINYISQIPVKIVVINATTIETLNSSIQGLETNGFGVEVSEIFISRSKVISNRRHMSALNPVFVITGEKNI